MIKKPSKALKDEVQHVKQSTTTTTQKTEQNKCICIFIIGIYYK